MKLPSRSWLYLFGLFLVVVMSSHESLAQRTTVSGTVSDEDGNPIPGVTVLIKGTTNGTLTSSQGLYTIPDVARTDSLSFSFIGLQTVVVQVGNRSTIDVLMVEDIEQLSEVIVVGYGTQEAKDVTGAISLVKKEDLQQRPNTQVAPLLYGKAAGVVVNPSSGKPGQGISINIRGNSSLGGSDPLYVVDGVPTRNTRFINPADVESITILKDASSAAIYGAQGATGVVLITTKTGDSEVPTISLDIYGGYSEVWNRLDVLNGEQYQELMTELGYNTNWDRFFYNTDWQDEIFQRGQTQNYQLSVSGKSNKTNYYISGGIIEETGAIRSAELKRQNFKLNLDQQLNSRIKAGARISYNNYADVDINDNSPANRSGVLLGALVTPSVINTFNPDGTFTANPFQDRENPLASTDGNERGYKSRRFLGNAFIEVSFLENFTYKSNFGLEQSNGEFTEFIDPFRTSFGRAVQGRGTSNVDRYNYQIFDNLLTFKKLYGKHSVEAMAGVISQYFFWEDQWLTTNSFAGDQITTAGAGANVESFGVSKAERRSISYVSRVNYAYEDRLLLTFNFRRDGSSIFGPDNRYGNFAAASVGWRISEEAFLKNSNVISNLKLRTGWGVNGNDPISPYAYLGLVSTGSDYAIGASILPGIYQSTIENRKLKWEETTQLNVGVDLELFEGRISSSLDVYNKQTDDVLLDNIPLPQTTGFSSARGNAVQLQNRGVELLINSVNIDKAVRWSSTLTFSANRNKVLSVRSDEIPGGFIVNRGSATITREGLPLSQFFGFEFAGVDPDNGRAQYRTAEGDLTYTPGEEDRKLIGNPHPDFVFGFTNTLSYKGIGLTIFIQGTQGNDMINATRFDIESMNGPSNQSAAVLRRWRNPGDITDVPGVSQIGNTENSILSTRFVEDASYVRLKTLTISYNLPSDLLQKVRIKGARIYATGENLLTICQESHTDALFPRTFRVPAGLSGWRTDWRQGAQGLR